MPATKLKSNKRDHCRLFFSSFQLVCFPSLQLMIGKKKLREHHTCNFTQAFPNEIGHTNIMIFSPISSTQCIYQALRFYRLFVPRHCVRLSLGVVRSPFSAQKRLLLLFTKQFKSCNNQNNDEDLFLITDCSFAKSISPTTWRKSDKGVK